MSRTLSQATKVNHGSYPGTSRADERPRNLLPRSSIHIAPRPSVYDALQPGEIRVVDIIPSHDRSTLIRAALRRQPLRYAKYEALSLACGSEELRAVVEVNGQPFSISSSLLEALRALRNKTNKRTVWVDSICVNQKDAEEKEKHIRLGAEIEGHASAVISCPWGSSTSRGILDVDGTVSTQWLIPSRTLSPPWNSAVSQAGDLETERCFDLTDCPSYYGSPPALTYSPKSPQTTSTFSSPDLSSDAQFQELCLNGMPYQFGRDSPFISTVDGPGLQQLLPNDEGVGKIPGRSQRKRSLLTAFPDELETPRSRKSQQAQPLSTGDNEQGPNVVFACPFQRFNPQKYHRCLKYTLNRIKDVKQHIYRQHSQPTLYCARCYEEFTTAGDRDAHSRLAVCEKRNPPQFEGITEQQRNELKKSSPKKKPLEEQWFELWEVVFPGRQRPQSAFIRNYVEEMIPMLRDLWDKKKAEIISGVMKARAGPATVDGDLIFDVMGFVFDRFEAETHHSSQASNTEPHEAGAGSLQQMTKFDSQFSGAEPCFEFTGAFEEPDLTHIGILDLDFGCAMDRGNHCFSQNGPAPLDARLGD